MESNATALMQLASVTFSAIDYVVLALFLALSSAVGVFFYCRSDKTTNDYFLGNRQLGPIPMGISTGVSFLSTASLMGYPAEMYTHGYSFMFANISGSLALIGTSCLVANVVQTLGISSPNDYFFMRHRSGLLCILAKLIVILCMLHYMGVSMLGSVVAFSSLTGGQISIVAGLTIGGAVGIFYTSLGGLKAVIWSDVLQASFMLFGILAVVAKSIVDTPGGMSAIIDVNHRYGRIHAPEWSFDPTIRHTMWGLVIGGIGNWILMSTQPATVQRLAAMKSKKDCYIASVITSAIHILLALLPAWAGINIFGFYTSKGCDINRRGWADKNDIIVYFVRDRLNYPGFQGLFLASLFAGSLSSLSSALNASSAILWEDVIRPNLRFQVSEVRAVIWSKVLVISSGILGMLWCYSLYSFGGLILQIGHSFNSSMYGSYFGLFMFSATFGWINAKGAIAGLLASFGVTCWLGLGSIFLGHPKTPVLPSTVESCPMNSSQSEPPVSRREDEDLSFMERLYSVSYLYFTFICLFINFSIALAVSFCTGRQKIVDPKLLFPCVRKVRICAGRTFEADDAKRGEMQDGSDGEEEENENAIPLKRASVRF